MSPDIGPKMSAARTLLLEQINAAGRRGKVNWLGYNSPFIWYSGTISMPSVNKEENVYDDITLS